jgi:mannonate dehydratase
MRHMAEKLRAAIGLPDDHFTEEHLRLAKQLGCDEVVVARPSRMLPGENGRWEYDDLARLREWVESFDLRVGAITNTPHSFWDKVRLGLPGREEQIENYLATIRNVGRAGIPILTYNFRPDPLYRTHTVRGRGGAEMTAFDRAKVDPTKLTYGRAFDAAHMWEAYTYFITRAIPAAEAAGVRLALHPDDPPGPPIGGVARIFSSFEGFERASHIVPSPAWALLFCVGCWTEMGGIDAVLRGIRHFGSKNQIAFVHLRDVQGEGDVFNECFIGDGQLDLTRVVRALKDVGFAGFVIDDHAPRMVGDEPPWHLRTRAYQAGYLQGLLRAIHDTG